jgi:heme exporter protein C
MQLTYSPRRSQFLSILTYASLVLFIAAMLMNFLYPGTERSMGEVQRLFYIHLGSFFGAFILFMAAVIAGINYLRTRDAKWDAMGVGSVELGLGLSSVTIVTGAIWARPIWGTYWTWDPRLTTIAIMWLTYAAYLFLRSAIEDPAQKRRFSAIYGILAFGSVILTVVIIRLRPDGIHPVVAGPTVTSETVEGDFDMTNPIRNTVLFNILTFIILSVTLLWHRIRLENLTEAMQARKAELLARL